MGGEETENPDGQRAGTQQPHPAPEPHPAIRGDNKALCPAWAETPLLTSPSAFPVAVELTKGPRGKGSPLSSQVTLGFKSFKRQKIISTMALQSPAPASCSRLIAPSQTSQHFKSRTFLALLSFSGQLNLNHDHFCTWDVNTTHVIWRTQGFCMHSGGIPSPACQSLLAYPPLSTASRNGS